VLAFKSRADPQLLSAARGGGAPHVGNPAQDIEANLMNTPNENEPSAVTAHLVPAEERVETLPRHFGRYMSVVEGLVYQFTRQLVGTYNGAYRQFYELSNGGFYMAPEIEPMHLYVQGNGFGQDMSPDAIGITACLFAFSHGSFRYPDETFARHYELLREFSYSHPEAGLISAAID